MDFKKKILQIFASKVNREFGEYKLGYQQILRDTTINIDDSQASGSSAIETGTGPYVQCDGNANISFQRGSMRNPRTADNTPSQSKPGGMCQAGANEVECQKGSGSENFSNRMNPNNVEMDSIKNPGGAGNTRGADPYEEISLLQTKPIISKCTVDETLLGDESKLFDNSMNMYSTNQTFFNGEFRRKARRRTGKLIIKRKYHLTDDSGDIFKKIKTDKVSSFYELYKELLARDKENTRNTIYLQEVKDLKNKLKETEWLLKKRREEEEEEREEVNRIKQEGLEVSKKIEMEMEKLMNIKKDISQEIKKIEVEKRRIQEEKDRLHAERITAEKKRLEDELSIESRRLDAEKTMIADEKKRLEEFKLLESKRLGEERMKMEHEKLEELKRIQANKESLELKLIEETKKIQMERKLIEEEREKINQTFLEITSRSVREPFKPKEVKIQLPPLFQSTASIKKCTTKTAISSRPLNELFFDAKREHAEKVNQTLLAPANTAQNAVEKPKPVFGKTAQKPLQGMINIEKMNPHSLYKTSIDVQTNSSDPKKYIPKTPIPFYTNEDEFDSESKKFAPALFTKDPKLNFLVKSQSHEEVRAFFGNKKDIDVETIFSGIENVTNQSPNKLRRKS